MRICISYLYSLVRNHSKKRSFFPRKDYILFMNTVSVFPELFMFFIIIPTAAYFGLVGIL